MKLIWSSRARDDLRHIGQYVAEFNTIAALALVRRLRQSAKVLADHPHIGRPGRVEDMRELPVSGTSYILPYRVRGGRVEILAAIHASRQWPDRF
jgi:addiction module RelE/StbE family toxin